MPSFHIDHDMRPLAQALEKRYPGVRVLGCCMSTVHDGAPQQNVRFRAPLPLLRYYGLLTDYVLADWGQARSRNATEIGDGYFLHDHESSTSIYPDAPPEGYFDFTLMTSGWPREPSRFSTKEARRELKRIFKAAKAKG